jgi:phage repressor protein C with HTH and peptisase S24 domain
MGCKPTVPVMSDFPVQASNWEALGGPERVRAAVEKGGGYTLVVRNSGISQSSLNEYLKGRTLRIDTALRLAAACGVSPQWLIFGEGNDAPTVAKTPPSSDGVLVNCYDEAEASAGFGRWGSDAQEPKKILISQSFLSDLGLAPNHTIIIRVTGDSMEPTLKTGDRIILNTAPAHILSGVTVFVSSGHLMVKRLAPTASGKVRIISDNERYPSEEADISRFRWGEPDGGDAITIIGRVAYRLQALS